jgi:hypothetical protein
MDSDRRTIWIADAHRDDGKRFVVRKASENQGKSSFWGKKLGLFRAVRRVVQTSASGARAIPATKYPCPVASKDRRP